MVVIEYILRYTHIILHLHSIITLYYVNPSNYTLKKVNFTICKTYLNKLGFHFLKHGKLRTPRSLGIILTALNHTRKAGLEVLFLRGSLFHSKRMCQLTCRCQSYINEQHSSQETQSRSSVTIGVELLHHYYFHQIVVGYHFHQITEYENKSKMLARHFPFQNFPPYTLDRKNSWHLIFRVAID